MKTSITLFASGFIILKSTAVLAAVHYVDANSTSPTPPFSTWATAATNIQDAVDVSAGGDEVVVTNGVYRSGSRAVSGAMTNRVAVDRPIFLHSVNGPQFTTIQGYQAPGTTNGPAAIRCVYLTNGASLFGFTLTNGGTAYPQGGGGVFCESGAVVSNCVLQGNSTAYHGGGIWGGAAYNCTIIGNSAEIYGGGAAIGSLSNCTLIANFGGSGGVYESTLTDCTLSGNTGNTGGGALHSTLSRCRLIGNSAGAWGGGAHGGALTNCLIAYNRSGNWGGGANESLLVNCTVVSNSAVTGGGISISTNGNAFNSIIYFNSANQSPNLSAATAYYCCTTPLPPSGMGNITNEPRFVNLAQGNFRLDCHSPCIDAGTNLYVATSIDLDGNPRIINGTVDIGAYEFQFGSGFDCPWRLTTAPKTNWSAVASSADGRKLAAVVNGGLIYTSTNWGDSWTATASPSNSWSTVSSSADGTILVAAANVGPVYFSTNSGITWIQAAVPVTNWTSVAVSASGTKVMAVATTCCTARGLFYASSDAAATWNQLSMTNEHWSALAAPADGAIWFLGASSGALNYEGHIFVSTNLGANWTQTPAPAQPWTSIASSADGSRVGAAPRGLPGGEPVTYIIPEPIYLSSDSAATWNPTVVADDWRSIASSADGMKLVAVTRGSIRSSDYPDGGLTYLSINAGASWITNVVPHASWTGAASSADGASLVAVAGTDSWGDVPAPGIYVLHSVPTPVLNATAAADKLLLSWILPSGNFVLQQSSTLAAPNWTDVIVTPTLNTTNLHYEASLPRPAGMMFYRLGTH